jgi:hypothetical protein
MIFILRSKGSYTVSFAMKTEQPPVGRPMPSQICRGYQTKFQLLQRFEYDKDPPRTLAPFILSMVNNFSDGVGIVTVSNAIDVWRHSNFIQNDGFIRNVPNRNHELRDTHRRLGMLLAECASSDRKEGNQRISGRQRRRPP